MKRNPLVLISKERLKAYKDAAKANVGAHLAKAIPEFEALDLTQQRALQRYAISHQGSIDRTLPNAQQLASLSGQDITTILKAASALPKPFTLSEYRERVAPIFRNRTLYDAQFGSEDRLYFELLSSPITSRVFEDVTSCLSALGYAVTDYKKGYCTDQTGKQKFKIGKLLKDTPVLLERFSIDRTRAGGDLMVVLSRHPYDLARMSTGRGWHSCTKKDRDGFNLITPDITQGTLVSYLIRKSDPNINDPLSRQLFKPYLDKDGREAVLIPQNAYGIRHNDFQETNTAICRDMFNAGKSGNFQMNEHVYSDRVDRYCHIYENGTITTSSEKLRDIPEAFRDGSATAQEMFDYLRVPYAIQDSPDGRYIHLKPASNLDLSRYGIRTLPKGMDRVILVNGSIDLNNNHLTTLCNLPQGLNEVRASSNIITTLLGSPQDIATLIINNNILSSLDGAAPTLTSLIADKNHITSLQHVPKAVKTLQLSHNQLTDLKHDLPCLQYIVAAMNEIVTLVGSPPSLKSLNVNGNHLNDLDGIPPNLSILNADDNYLTSIAQVPPTISILNINDNKLTRFEGSFPNLGYLSASENQLQSLSIDAPILKELVARNNALSSIADAPRSVSVMEVDRNRITDLKGAPPNLQRLFVNYNEIISVEGLPDTLHSLHISCNRLSSLKGLPQNLKELFASSNSITSLDGIPAGTRSVLLNGNPVIAARQSNEFGLSI